MGLGTASNFCDELPQQETGPEPEAGWDAPESRAMLDCDDRVSPSPRPPRKEFRTCLNSHIDEVIHLESRLRKRRWREGRVQRQDSKRQVGQARETSYAFLPMSSEILEGRYWSTL